jgi:acyl-coenzyme A synthetase/AMP-(fatty) acid ligase
MRNLSASKPPGDTSRRGSAAGINAPVNQAHTKYKGLISTPGYCKFSAWRRETEIPRQPFSRLILSSLAAQKPDRLWLKDQTTGRSETFGQVGDHVASIAAGLLELGFSPGDVVCLWCSNYVEYWLVCLAVWELGGATLPVNCLISLDKLEAQLKETGVSMLVCDTFNVEDGCKLHEEVESLKSILVIGQDAVPEGVVSISKLLEKKSPARPSYPKFDWEKSVLCLLYTTRSGQSRVVKHTNKSITAQVFSPKGTSNHWFDQILGDCIFCGNWFFHFTGFHSFALSAVHGLTMYFLSEYSDNDLLTALADLAISNAVLYPWQVRMLSQSASVEIFELSHLKVLITGGSILGPTTGREILERLPNLRFIRESYGLKETGMLTYTYPRFDKSGVTLNKVPDDHLMPLGFPNMWTSFKVVDRQTGQPVSGPDLQGELCVKTCQLLPGYLGQEEPLVDNEGYFHTGDLGYYDSNGVIYFVEQISSLISFWMYEIAPSVLESRLLSHASVVDAAVVAIPDKENGQIPRGFVVLKTGHEETEENLINFLESRLQDHERLRGGLHYIQHIPRDENWKVVRSVLQKFVPPPKGESEGGLMVCSIAQQEVTSSPRTKRAAEAAALLLNPTDEALQNKEPEEIFGMKSRSRRGSQENILENNFGSASVNNGTRGGPIPEIVMEGDTSEGEELSYWLRVSVGTSQLEREIAAHPSVGEVVVRGVHVPGVGVLPRAYVTLKQGFSIPGEELANLFNSRLDWRHRLRGGVVVAERLPRDPQGVLLVNLEKLDHSVVAVQTFDENDLYSANNITHI